MQSNQATHSVIYRPANPKDMRFILDSWMKSWRTSAWAGVIPNNRYFEVQRDCIEQLIARGAEIIVAAWPKDPSRILGWVCYELTQDIPARTVINYLYVKDPYLPLRPSIALGLLAATPGVKPGYYTHRYRTVAESCTAGEGWRHAPEIARRAYQPDRKQRRQPTEAPSPALP